MTDRPVELDEHRGMAAQTSTELRRRLHKVQADQAALRRRQDEAAGKIKGGVARLLFWPSFFHPNTNRRM